MPIFNASDSDECRVYVNRHYRTASLTVTDAKTAEARLEASYEAILGKQTEYGVNLARNDEFREWCIDDFEIVYRRGQPVATDVSDFV